MRKITTTYFCDRCKKEINASHWRVNIPDTCDPNMPAVFQTKDLCDDCLRELFKWFENKNNECPFETYGMG